MIGKVIVKRKLSTLCNCIVNVIIIIAFLLDPLEARPQNFDASYFPLPKNKLKVIRSETQSFSVDTVVKGLSRPWSLVFLPNQVVLIAQRSGKLLMVKAGQVQKTPVGGNVPRGLRDIKLHPAFDKNGWIYISYYIEPKGKSGGETVLMRGRIKNDKWIDASILYRAGPFTLNGQAYGSKIAFDTKGYLYFTVGIRGDRKGAQDKSKHSGKTMRLYDDGRIPKDNPFVHTPGALPEIFSYGHRMHEGLVRNPYTGEIWSSELGEFGGDEINILKAGANYGWPVVTFSREYSGKIISKDSIRSDVASPIHHFYISPSDLDFNTGDRYPGWKGNLFIGALAKRLVNRSVVVNNKVVHAERLLKNIGRVRDVKFGPDKFLYVLVEDKGILVRLLPVEK